ncbi:MAG: hypothetical protein ACI8ZB_004900 [Desulforhopalus sp.]|jgi:hypothetical protein
MNYPILDVCARTHGHPAQHQMLREYCDAFEDWNALLQQAEKEGLSPLLKKHLEESESSYPAGVRRSLNLLVKRHHKQAKIRLKVLQEVLVLFKSMEMTPLLIKGAALCYTLYQEPYLRPMRDMDILLSENDVDKAQEVLVKSGFTQSRSPIPADHHHLPSLMKTVDGVAVCIELHRGLYPNCPPYYPEIDFDSLLKSARKIKVGEMEAFTFNDEEMLYYLYQHALHAPLTYEGFKLINICDIISFTEKHSLTLDWEKIRNDFPLLFNALPLLDHISPWNREKVPGFIPDSWLNKYSVPRPFTGWPFTRRKGFKANKVRLFTVLNSTFLPPIWWASVYYGFNSFRGYVQCVLWNHPRQIVWWARLYGAMKN